MTLESGNIRCGYSRVFPGEGASNYSVIIEKVGFQGSGTIENETNITV